MFCEPTEQTQALRSDQLTRWLVREWLPAKGFVQYETVWTTENCTNDYVLGKVNPTQSFGGYYFASYQPIACNVAEMIDQIDSDGVLRNRKGAFEFCFKSVDGADEVVVAVATVQYTDNYWYTVSVASIPMAFRVAWASFTHECDRLAYAIEPSGRVIVVGGNHTSFVPTVKWDEIILPDDLKTDILHDVQAFFVKGVPLYQRLNLKPFRKFLLAGVPGTGKTMLCNALAKWALDKDYLVIYVSSAKKGQNDAYGSSFEKIQHALEIAAQSETPAIVIIEELDAYLHDDQKALILNVLDGSESSVNPYGTLLISTTNYPEAIDERIMKRPGRLDRVFIIPQMKTRETAEAMLRIYMGELWQDEHLAVAEQLVGYAGAFVREVALYALTQAAFADLTVVTVAMLQDSFDTLKAQIEARDIFLMERLPQPEPTPEAVTE